MSQKKVVTRGCYELLANLPMMDNLPLMDKYYISLYSIKGCNKIECCETSLRTTAHETTINSLSAIL
jgi:hypothetical protein